MVDYQEAFCQFDECISFIYHLSHAKRKCTCQHAQNAQIHIILRMRKISFGHLLSIHTFLYYPMILFAGSEGPDQTARMRRLIWAFAVRICSKTRFCMAPPITWINQFVSATDKELPRLQIVIWMHRGKMYLWCIYVQRMPRSACAFACWSEQLLSA